MSATNFQPTPELTDLLVRSGSHNKEHAVAANAEFAKALELPLRQGILNGDILDDEDGNDDQHDLEIAS